MIRARGARVAVIGLGDLAHARAFRDETRLPFPLLVDEARAAYRAAGLGSASILHLLRWRDIRARMRDRAAGHRQRRLGRNPFQLGGSFAFGPGDVDRYAHVSRTFGDSAPVDDILAALDR